MGTATPISFPRNGVTIGIPFYNEAPYLEATLRSAVTQCEAVWASDNASTDGGLAICEGMKREYSNVSIVRLTKNMGPAFNFKHVLDQATTPYFMWLGGHDLLPPDYVPILVATLESDPEAVLAYGSTRYIGLNGEETGSYEYAFHRLLSDRSSSVRTMALIRYLDDCSLFHGLFRTSVLRATWDGCGSTGYLGKDHALLSDAAVKGPFLYRPQTHLIRRNVHPGDTSAAQQKRITSADSEVSFAAMQREQFRLAELVSRQGGPSAWLYRLRARYHLVSRFGPFGQTVVTSAFDRLLQRRHVRFSMRQLDRLLDATDANAPR